MSTWVSVSVCVCCPPPGMCVYVYLIVCQTPRALSSPWHNAASVEKILGTKNKLEDSGAGGQNYEEKHSEDAMKNIWGL